MKQEITGVLLAAGQSQRFGQNKLLYPLADGTPVAVASARNLLAVLPDSCAVVADADHKIVDLLVDEGMHIIVNPDAAQGMGTSIASAIQSNIHASAWLIALADMPYISSQIVEIIVENIESPGDIVAPFYKNLRGHPVAFGCHYKNELAQLGSDKGARDIIRTHARNLRKVVVEDKSVVSDIDRLDDIDALSSVKK